MPLPHYTAQSILDQLDQCAHDRTFPMLDNGYVYPVDVHLTAYRDASRWAIVIQAIGVHNHAFKHDRIQNALHCFGNCLKQPPGLNNQRFLFPTSDGLDGSSFADDNVWYMHPQATSIRVRDVVVPISRDVDIFVQKGIERELPSAITVIECIRSLFPEYRALFLATDAELRQHIPTDLPQLLELREWQHPDLIADELPSHTQTFQMLADVLETGNPERYQGDIVPNTHWRNWPEGGMC